MSSCFIFYLIYIHYIGNKTERNRDLFDITTVPILTCFFPISYTNHTKFEIHRAMSKFNVNIKLLYN